MPQFIIIFNSIKEILLNQDNIKKIIAESADNQNQISQILTESAQLQQQVSESLNNSAQLQNQINEIQQQLFTISQEFGKISTGIMQNLNEGIAQNQKDLVGNFLEHENVIQIILHNYNLLKESVNQNSICLGLTELALKEILKAIEELQK